MLTKEHIVRLKAADVLFFKTICGYRVAIVKFIKVKLNGLTRATDVGIVSL